MAKVQTTDSYARLRTSIRWKPEDAARVLADCARSGESMTAFAQRHRLKLKRLYKWRARLAGSNRKSAQAVRLVPAFVRPAPLIALTSQSSHAAACVVMNDVRIEISAGQASDARWLAELVCCLRGARS